MNAMQCREAGKINKSVVGKLAYKYKTKMQDMHILISSCPYNLKQLNLHT